MDIDIDEIFPKPSFSSCVAPLFWRKQARKYMSLGVWYKMTVSTHTCYGKKRCNNHCFLPFKVLSLINYSISQKLMR